MLNQDSIISVIQTLHEPELVIHIEDQDRCKAIADEEVNFDLNDRDVDEVDIEPIEITLVDAVY